MNSVTLLWITRSIPFCIQLASLIFNAPQMFLASMYLFIIIFFFLHSEYNNAPWIRLSFERLIKRDLRFGWMKCIKFGVSVFILFFLKVSLNLVCFIQEEWGCSITIDIISNVRSEGNKFWNFINDFFSVRFFKMWFLSDCRQRLPDTHFRHSPQATYLKLNRNYSAQIYWSVDNMILFF